MRLLRELSRRKLRTTLTIIGITIGIWALVVFSSMANQINGLVGSGSEFYADKIVVTDGAAFGTSPMRLASMRTPSRLDGVAAVDPQVELLWDDDPGVAFGVPDMIIGSIPGADEGHEPFELELATGRMLTPEDAGNVVVLGSTLATSQACAGDSVEIRGEPFEVVGTLQPTLTSPDTTGLVPLATAQELFLETLPPLVAESLEADELANQIVVYPDDGADFDVLAARSRRRREQRDHDRRRVRRAGRRHDRDLQRDHHRRRGHQPDRRRPVGHQHDGHERRRADARDRHQARHRRLARPDHPRARRRGRPHRPHRRPPRPRPRRPRRRPRQRGRTRQRHRPLRPDPETAVFAVGFSTILGMLAGIIPAWSAARLDPVAALRYE